MDTQNNYFFSVENNSYNEETGTTEQYVSGYYRTFEEVQRHIEARANIHGLQFEIFGTGKPTYNEIDKPQYGLYSVRYFRGGKLVLPHKDGIYLPRFITPLQFN